ncbi:hypothetical protein [Leptospira weilii]|uniref:hypothetical protein n=1 Tax=Leptospira weilii TaxID=28184 RepID=UPI000A9319AA|nr:hypothetical protein [Leptospira weilii]
MKLILINSISIILLFSTNKLYSQKISAEVESDRLIIKYENKIFKTKTLGNSITRYHAFGKKYIFELHINPSLGELIVFDTVKKTTEDAYLYTNYHITKDNLIIILLSSPHYTQDRIDGNRWSLYVNHKLLKKNLVVKDRISFDEEKNLIKIYDGEKFLLKLVKSENHIDVHTLTPES